MIMKGVRELKPSLAVKMTFFLKKGKNETNLVIFWNLMESSYDVDMYKLLRSYVICGYALLMSLNMNTLFSEN